MKATRTAIDGLILLEPDVHKDARGHFVVTWSQDGFDQIVGRSVQFVQDNCSHSRHAVLRGLHYQVGPQAQGRLVHVLHGTVFDVAVDVRRTSSSYGRWVGTELSDTNHRMAWLPPGLAHGFLVLSSSAVFAYKSTASYEPQAERCIRWNDPMLAIAWPDVGRPPILNDRDATAPLLN